MQAGGLRGPKLIRYFPGAGKGGLFRCAKKYGLRGRRPQGRILADLSIPFEIIPDVAKAVGTAVQRSRPVDRVCVTGSFFVLGEVPRPVLPPFAPELGDPPPQQASGK